MFCQHCGAELPNSEGFCPSCGSRIGSGEITISPMGTFRIFRKDTGCIFKTSIFVDGELKDSVWNDKTTEFLLPAGLHQLTLKTKNMEDFSYTVTIEPDTITFFRFKLAMGMVHGSHKLLGISNIEKQSYVPIPQMTRISVNADTGPICPHCGGTMVMQTVTESRKSGCGTLILYVLLALTIFGLLIVIPLMLRKKTETVTYAVCQRCGRKRVVSRS